MNKEDGLVKSIFNYSISSWINILLGLVYTIVSTRVLLPDTYGTVSIFISASNTLMYIVCFGLDASFVRFYNERPENESKNLFTFKLIFLISINIMIAFFISTVFLFDWFNNFMFGQSSWFLTIMLYGSTYSNLLLRFFNIIYRMSFNVRQYTIQNVLIQSSTKILTLIAAFVNPSYEVVITFQVIGIVGITIIYIFLQRKDISPLYEDVKNVFRYSGYMPVVKYALFSAPVYISTNLNVLLTQQIIRNLLGSVSLGIYSVVNVFVTLYGAVQTGFSTFWSAYVYKNYKEEQKKIAIMTDYVMLIATLSLSAFVLFRKVLYAFIGEKYQSSITFFSIVLMVNIFNFLSQATVYGIDIVKKNHITAISNCIYVTFNAILVFISAKYWGLLGVAYAIMTTRLLLFLINTIIGQKFYRTIINVRRFILGLIVILLISVLPSLNIQYYFVNLFVILLIALTLIIYREQYLYAYGMLKKKYK